VGSFNQSVVLMHRSISKKPLTGYIASKMPATETEIEIYIRELHRSKKYLT
jgi:hypothetical protein